MTRGLVLGGGGVAGIAWEIGVLRGLEEAGMPMGGWSVVVGTSAGSIVGARILTDPDLERWFAHETRPITAAEDDLIRRLGGRTGGLALRLGRRRGLGWVSPAWLTALSLEAMVRHRARGRPAGAAPVLPAAIRQIEAPTPALARLGAVARAARTPSEASFVSVIEDVLGPVRAWPPVLLVTAVDTADGAAYALGADAGVPLLRAVAASAAVPILFPAIRLLGRRWMDGGMVSTTHALLAGGADEILVIAPLRSRQLDAEVAALRAPGRRVTVVTPGPEASRILGFGVGLLDPVRRPAAALAGREDGRAAAAATALLTGMGPAADLASVATTASQAAG